MVRLFYHLIIAPGAVLPLYAISIGALLTRPDLRWVAYFVASILVLSTARSLGSAVHTKRGLQDLSQSYLSSDDLILTRVDPQPYLEGLGFEVLGAVRDQLRARFEQLGGFERQLQAAFFTKPDVLAFLVASKSGRFVGAAKTYSSMRGPSFIFLAKSLEEMSKHDRFVLAHELAHASPRGVLFEVIMNARVVHVSVAVIFGASIVDASTVAVPFGVYLLWNALAFWNRRGYREAIADTTALTHQLRSGFDTVILDNVEILTYEKRELSRRLRFGMRWRELLTRRNFLVMAYNGMKMPAVTPPNPGMALLMAVWFFLLGTRHSVQPPAWLALILISVFALDHLLWGFRARATVYHYDRIFEKLQSLLLTPQS